MNIKGNCKKKIKNGGKKEPKRTHEIVRARSGGTRSGRFAPAEVVTETPVRWWSAASVRAETSRRVREHRATDIKEELDDIIARRLQIISDIAADTAANKRGS